MSTPAQTAASAASAGFYRRRRGIYEHLEIGDIDLLDLGLHDWLCGHARALMDSDRYPAGVWIGNAEVIWQMTGRQAFHMPA